MSLSMKRTVGAVVTAPSFSRTPRMAVLTRAKEQPTIDPVGYINNDNSGKGNMFPTIAKPFVSSPNTSELASSGLGGLQGGAVLAAVIAVVGVATAGIAGQSGETLQTVVGAYDGDSLAAIASRIAATL